MYAVPLVVDSRLTDATALAVAFSSAVGLTRLALLVLFPLQAPLLPKLSAAAAQGRMADVRRGTAILAAVCAAAGIGGVVVAGVSGPWILHTIMGTKAYLSPGLLMQLSAGTLFLLLANALQSTLIALNRQQGVLFGWCLGVVAMSAVFAAPFSVLTTAAVASIAGPLVTTIFMTGDVLRTTAARMAQPSVNAEPPPLGSAQAPPPDGTEPVTDGSAQAQARTASAPDPGNTVFRS
jgi:O-antigen/teichoic acid export membrane protein